MTPDLSALTGSFLHWLHQREVRHDDRVSLEHFGQAYMQLTEFARQADARTQDLVLQALKAGLSPAQSNWEFGSLACACGTIVEYGGDPALVIEPILDRITQQFARVPELVDVMQKQLGVDHPNRVAEQDWPRFARAYLDHAWVIGEWYALRYTGCAAMTMLCRDVQARRRARQRIELFESAEAVRDDNPFAYYLAELLGMVDDEPLLVLDMPRRLGFRVRLMAIRNNFHLFTLLQDALLSHPTAAGWQGPRVHPVVVSAAKGERTLTDISPNEWPGGIEGDSAIWTYHTWLAMKPDGTLQAYSESKNTMPAWVWGEMKPTQIPDLEGTRLILLGPLECGRSWNAGFFAPLHSALRSSARIEQVLSDDEYREWIGKIRLRAGMQNER